MNLADGEFKQSRSKGGNPVHRRVPEGPQGVHRLSGGVARGQYTGETLDEARENLQEAIALVLEANRVLAEESLRGREVIREPLRIRAA